MLKWVTDTVQAPAGLGSAFARNYVSFNHSLGGTSGFPEHDAAKFIVVLGWAQKDAHRRRETDSVPQGMQQSLRNLATDLYNAAHACPHLFLAALKSGSHPTKCGLCVPVFGFRLGGGFSNFDKLRSKDVLVPESKAFVSYLQEMLKICDGNKASALLATEMDIGHLRSIVKEELRRGWLGHSKVMSWKDTKPQFLDEFGNQISAGGGYARDDVEDELIFLKSATKIFAPRSPILATPGVKNIEDSTNDWTNACTQHRKSLRAKLTDEEAKVYQELLTAGTPNLLSFTKAVQGVVTNDTANRQAIIAWAVQVANGTLAQTPTAANPGTAVASLVNFVNQNGRMIAGVYGLNSMESSSEVRI